jgi:RNA polymerase sigma-70 factor (ECF subfamily)
MALSLTRDEEEAKDLLQEAIYLIIKHRSSYQSDANFVGWVMTVIRNTFKSNYRKEKRRAQLLDRDMPDGVWLGVRTTINPAPGALGAEEIMVMVNALPKIYREAFLLFYQGLKYKEIAVRTAVPIGTAKSRVFTARKILQEGLEV